MAVPKFHEFMLPVLTLLGDGREYSVPQIKDAAVNQMKLSEGDLSELLPSGRKTRVNDRIEWAKTYLKMAGLVTVPRRGMALITEEGKKVLADNPPNITIAYLSRYPAFQQFRNGITVSTNDNSEQHESDLAQALTPDEIIEKNIKGLNAILADEIIEKLKVIDPSAFERLVMDLLTAMGYVGASGSASVVGKSGDGGIDGIVNEDKLGLSKIYVQAKRWEANVGDIEIGRFLGSLHSRGATKGVFITTSDYTKQAKETIETRRSSTEVVLLNGQHLADLMIEYGLGVSTQATYQIKRIDTDFFVDN